MAMLPARVLSPADSYRSSANSFANTADSLIESRYPMRIVGENRKVEGERS